MVRGRDSTVCGCDTASPSERDGRLEWKRPRTLQRHRISGTSSMLRPSNRDRIKMDFLKNYYCPQGLFLINSGQLLNRSRLQRMRQRLSGIEPREENRREPCQKTQPSMPIFGKQKTIQAECREEPSLTIESQDNDFAKAQRI